jgi:hypothetical protein
VRTRRWPTSYGKWVGLPFDSIRAQQIEVIFDRVAAGETLETVCKDEGIPARASSTPPLSDPLGEIPPGRGYGTQVARGSLGAAKA